jgi:hypothetical protein
MVSYNKENKITPCGVGVGNSIAFGLRDPL